MAATTDTQTLHPYFEDASSGRWLFARVVSLDPVALFFSAEPASTFTPTMHSRIRHQFKQFRLAELYGTQASRQIAGERLRLNQLRQRSGHAALSEHVRETAASWAATPLSAVQRHIAPGHAVRSTFDLVR